MITRNALYAVVDNLIDTAAPTSALFGAVSFRNVRGSVEAALKVVRVECFAGIHVMTAESQRKEHGVTATVHAYVLPAIANDEASLDTAMDVSFDMSREIFEGLAVNTHLNGLVCDSFFEEFETSYVNIGATRYAVTWLDGTINQIG